MGMAGRGGWRCGTRGFAAKEQEATAPETGKVDGMQRYAPRRRRRRKLAVMQPRQLLGTVQALAAKTTRPPMSAYELTRHTRSVTVCCSDATVVARRCTSVSKLAWRASALARRAAAVGVVALGALPQGADCAAG